MICSLLLTRLLSERRGCPADPVLPEVNSRVGKREEQTAKKEVCQSSSATPTRTPSLCLFLPISDGLNPSIIGTTYKISTSGSAESAHNPYAKMQTHVYMPK